MTTYRVFVGSWDDEEGAIFLAIELSWNEARKLLMESFVSFVDNKCEICKEDAAWAAIKLWSTNQPRPFAVEIDGVDYMIVEEKT